jgi:adenosylhomocysteine nucleosidase
LKVAGIVCALRTEARHFGCRELRPGSVQTLSDGTLISMSGMGPAAASLAAHRLIVAGAGAIMSWGMAGALDPSLQPGTVLLPAAVLCALGERLPVDSDWRERLAAAVAPGYALAQGTLLSSASVIATPEHKRRLFADTGACAVDMESFAIGQVAAQHQLPFVVLRVVIDTASDSLPPIVTAAVDQYGEVRIGPLMVALLRAPWALPALLRIAHRHGSARRALAGLAHLGQPKSPASYAFAAATGAHSAAPGSSPDP